MLVNQSSQTGDHNNCATKTIMCFLLAMEFWTIALAQVSSMDAPCSASSTLSTLSKRHYTLPGNMVYFKSQKKGFSILVQLRGSRPSQSQVMAEKGLFGCDFFHMHIHLGQPHFHFYNPKSSSAKKQSCMHTCTHTYTHTFSHIEIKARL